MLFPGDTIHLAGNAFPVSVSSSLSPAATVALDFEDPISETPKKRKTSALVSSVELPAPKRQKTQPPSETAFSVLMKNAVSKVSPAPQPTKRASPVQAASAAGGFAGALAPYVLTPEKFPDAVYHYDDKSVVIHDKYPKARFHFLVMPRTLIDGFRPLTKSSLPMLQELKSVADKVVKTCVAAIVCARHISLTSTPTLSVESLRRIRV